MYAYCGNNPVARIDENGCFFDFFGKAVNKVKDEFIAFAERTVNAASQAFEFEVGWGPGLSTSYNSGSSQVSIGAYYDSVTLGYENGAPYTAIKGEVGLSYTPFDEKVGIGVSTEFTHYYEIDGVRYLDGHNTTSNPFDVYACEKTVKDNDIFLIFDVTGDNTSDSFIGYSIENHFIVGGHFKIGFDLNEFWNAIWSE